MSPLQQVLQHSQGATRVVGVVAMLGFAVLYLLAFDWSRRVRRRGERVPLGRAAGALLVLLGVGALTVPAAGEKSLALLVYLTVAAMVMLPSRLAWAAAATAALAAAGLPVAVPSWDGDSSLAVSVLLAAFVLWGILGIVERNAALTRAREELARLAVEEERARFARDLHDALADIRATVSGVRRVSLAGELASARSALAAAGIAADLPTAVDDVPEGNRELFAWAVREGVTNVIRHSRARRCTITLTASWVEVIDDGPGPGHHALPGHGLTGLAERARRQAGELLTSSAPNGGFRLRVQA